MKNELHVIFGASGGIGNAIIRELVAEGKNVRGVNRSGKASVPKGVELVAGDLLDPVSAMKAIKGATHVYNCVNVNYTQWENTFPKFTSAFIKLLEKSKIKGIIIDNLYMYGEDLSFPFTEDRHYSAHGKKGKVRGRCAIMYDEAMNKGRIEAVVFRAPDFYGPGVTHSSFYGDRFYPNILAGKNVQLFGKLDVPHSIIFVDDYARGVVSIIDDKEAYGKTWHVPMDRALTQREFTDLAFKIAGTSGKVSTMPKLLISILGLFIPMIREVKEMIYEFEEPYLVNTSKYQEKYGNGATSHEDAIKMTLDWYRKEYSSN
ncbi:MAG: NAD-dependent epimerase/dehydratase family protein [Candidatus Heimdallarchaeota archaeon]|nr:NAD-dependent epimerase/dehydratase family protein [Candidatus Heimdallarchaeota archaeon]